MKQAGYEFRTYKRTLVLRNRYIAVEFKTMGVCGGRLYHRVKKGFRQMHEQVSINRY